MNINYRAGRAGPIREGRDDVSKRGIVDLVDQDSQERVGLVVGIGLKLRVDLNNERGGDGGEQTGLKT